MSVYDIFSVGGILKQSLVIFVSSIIYKQANIHNNMWTYIYHPKLSR